jgi:hypothetical protein
MGKQESGAPFFPKGKGPLQRIGEVQLRKGIRPRTLHSCLRRLGWRLSLAAIKELEDPRADLLVSELWLVAEALEVSVEDLCCEGAADIPALALTKRGMTGMLKKAERILEQCHAESRTGRMAAVLIEQLIELEPDLRAPHAKWEAEQARRPLAGLLFREQAEDDPEDEADEE